MTAADCLLWWEYGLWSMIGWGIAVGLMALLMTVLKRFLW